MEVDGRYAARAFRKCRARCKRVYTRVTHKARVSEARPNGTSGPPENTQKNPRVSTQKNAPFCVSSRVSFAPHSLSHRHITCTGAPLPPRWPAGLGGGRWISTSTPARLRPGRGRFVLDGNGKRVRSSTTFFEGRDHGGGDENRRTQRVRDGYRAVGGNSGARGGGGRGHSGGGSGAKGSCGRGGTKSPRPSSMRR